MKERRIIDLSTEDLKREFFKKLASFNTKKEAYEYLGVSPNSYGIAYLKKLAQEVGFDLDSYHKRKTKKCVECGKDFYPAYSTQRFCSHSCSAKSSNKKRGTVKSETKLKIGNSLRKYYLDKPHKDEEHRTINKKKIRIKNSICPICGSRECGRTGICRHTVKFFETLSYFGFDLKKLGTSDVFDEYERVKLILCDEYFVKKMSPRELKEKYKYPKTYENITLTLKAMGIKTRNQSESQINSLLNGKLTPPCTSEKRGLFFHSGYHTTWEGTKIFYRSGDELEYAELLDREKVSYRVEDLRFEYYDTQTKTTRVAIPDFHLINKNEIVEVKGRITFDKQNMIDKFAEYKKRGFVPKMRYEGVIYDEDEIKNINEYKFNIDSLRHK